MDSDTSPAPEGVSAQEKARLRRERRQAKIAAGGASRLEQITSMAGRPAPAPDAPAPSTGAAAPANPPATSTTTASHTTDPDEVDISALPRPAPRAPSTGTSTPSLFGLPASSGPNDPAADPMFQMLQQMMQGGGFGDGMPGGRPFPGVGGPPSAGMGGDGPSGLPPGLADLLGGMGGAGGGSAAPEPAETPRSAQIWRVVHALFSLGLALYISLTSSFDGGPAARSLASASHDEAALAGEHGTANVGRRLFVLFATFEALAQTGRFFLEKGQLGGSGWLATLGRVLPEPWAGYVRIVGRYATIWRTVMADVMVIVFVLGMMAWWRV
ncbi:hypothetical protein BDY21DRAFT_384075 [Lineolata rhizophorae]|uniref:GET complex, subunit GET2 n=1 Tax=Lineolata rhizophorae TaxID=578093 RepID=A0A6A6PAJ8_9PEZI|nr:hypothetical protein BDY21DRAFT_384075 [Lineolata rhizophorae]